MGEDLKEVREGVMQVSGAKSLPGRGKSMCKGPEVVVWLVCLEIGKVRMPGVERPRGRMVGIEVREVILG